VDLLVTSFFIEQIVYCYLININTKKSRKFIIIYLGVSINIVKSLNKHPINNRKVIDSVPTD